MLRKKILSFIMAAAFLISLSGTGHAIIINPVPAVLNDDNGASRFNPSALVLNFSVADITATLPASWSSIFGFYYTSNPSTKITIFGADDIRTVPQSAAIDFGTGNVYDIDNGTVESSFVVKPGTSIGFFQYFVNSDPSVASLLEYSEAGLNPGGLKASAVFQLKSDPSINLIGFEEPMSGTLLSYNILGGVTAVPEPSSLILLGSGLCMVGLFNRKRLSSKIKNAIKKI